MSGNRQAEESASSREQFVQQLRERAEQAVELSVRHARLAQHFMELSTRYEQLAEQVGTAGSEQLRRQIQELEAATNVEDRFLPIAAGPYAVSDERATFGKTGAATSDADASLTSLVKTPNHSDAAAAQFSEHSADTNPAIPDQPNSALPDGRMNRRGNRSFIPRLFVQRVRSVRLSNRRIRVRAAKADLQPKIRTAVDELDRGKGSLMASGIVLLVSLFLMRMVTWQSEIPRRLDPIVAAFAAEEPPKPAEPIEPPDEMPGEQTEVPETEPVETAEEPEPVEPEPAQDMPNEQPDPPESETPDVEPPPPAEPEALTASTADPAKEPADQTNPTNSGVSETPPEQPASAHSADDSRSGARREELLKKYGGSQQSEAAVGRALQWLASIQHPQGWWDFVQVGPAGTPGTVNNPIGGTAYALLPFLAAGHTHKSGDYRKQVQSGLNYLTQIGVTVPAGYDLRGMINKQSDDREPNEAYYVHGAATLVLCEAFGMTKDRRLKPAAEGAVRFLVNSQDPRGGGWRYSPQEPGSTSVTAIQVMALKAAQKAGLNVPDSVLHRVSVYLDSVQVDGQGRYGYEIQRKSYKGSVTAMALLCRMYLGWQREDGDLRAGVALLDKAGPYDNLYTTYFATQVMKNWGGEEWDRWNQRVRDDLIAGQESEGPAAGSWRPRTGAIHAKQGGRLLTTVLATLTLEVYYRYSPLLPEAGPHTEPKVVPDADSGAAALKASDE